MYYNIFGNASQEFKTHLFLILPSCCPRDPEQNLFSSLNADK